MNAVLEILKLGVVGLIASLFTSFLANRDYRQRKWWELRAIAYQDAIGHLSDLVYYYEVNLNAEINRRDIPKDFQDKLDKYWNDAFPKVRRLADSGAFLFSDEASAALKEFMKEDTNEHSHWEHLDNQLSRAMKCLARLVECSKVDLKLKQSIIGRFI